MIIFIAMAYFSKPLAIGSNKADYTFSSFKSRSTHLYTCIYHTSDINNK